ncbi:hypothetical protein AXG93_59s1160 [Marchantia polymorpha subsp. ruderalis]|uniref:HAT C-terminal dimerisation domain-containing protein n=1 Tax=Marchantia polymorpha subsp. ruderalis TaxID=1480154 RepID=A0A176W3T0_MARPO|nr:hypothetical protein AXG93_59s1160 [Marchantia polymorpha subsp. ruderalis]
MLIVTKQEKDTMTAAEINYYSTNRHLFESLSGLDLKALDIGSSSTDRITINKLFTNLTTISRNVNSHALNGREKLTLVLEKHLDSDLNVIYPIMKSCLVRLDVECNQIELAKDKLKDAMIKYAHLDISPAQSPVRKKSRLSVLMYDQMLDNEFHVLSWWRCKDKDVLPILERVMRSILCIPASSTMSENNFSDDKNILTKKYNRLKPERSVQDYG